jgi:hypothetical protein
MVPLTEPDHFSTIGAACHVIADIATGGFQVGNDALLIAAILLSGSDILCGQTILELVAGHLHVLHLHHRRNFPSPGFISCAVAHVTQATRTNATKVRIMQLLLEQRDYRKNTGLNPPTVQ